MIEVDIVKNNSDNAINSKNLKTYCKEVLNYKGYKSYSVSLIFVNEEKLKEMKNTYFQQNLYTDVIAFNLNNENEDLEGELYLSIEIIGHNAKLYNVSLDDEIKRVVAHGILHLIGYDDDNDSSKRQMTENEDSCIKLFKNISIVC
ncbi:MAG: rRNA maturation RNase YbeY [Candidatus Marinimicrobia bacterium]|nr:rRNA maturation RNase YbeY [Candidatus Neomarinimicrobiota bacterium]